MKRLVYVILIALLVFVIATIGGAFYMVDYALAPNPLRLDTAARFARLYDEYPETKPWIDSLRRTGAFRDTFVVMPSGERHHAYLIGSDAAKTAINVHGWREQGIAMLMIARLYEQMGYRVVVPDLHAHGLSEGDAVGMGWKERYDILHWMKLFRSDTMVVHGISMGAATTMNVSGETPPEGIRSLRFVEDCGYTSVWDEFSFQMGVDFGLPDFPLMYASSLLCQLKYGWSFSEAAPLSQVAKCRYPMLFIHGDSDDFVPSQMVRPLYAAKQGEKKLWETKGSAHALSYKDHREEYTARIEDFCEGK